MMLWILLPPTSTTGAGGSGTWCWDRTENTDYYILLTAEPGVPWLAEEIAGQEETERICTFTPVPHPPGVFVLFAVVACNQWGCSSTQHGDFPGEGYDGSEDSPPWMVFP